MLQACVRRLTSSLAPQILSIISSLALDWLAPSIACGLSLSVVVANMLPSIEAHIRDPTTQGCLAVLAGGHLVFALLLKLYFFA